MSSNPLSLQSASSIPPAPSSFASPTSCSSIYQLARRYCRERIIVEPLQWTSRHLELLQIIFEDPQPAPPLIARPSFTSRSNDTLCANILSTSKERKFLAMGSLLTNEGCPFTGTDRIQFRFAESWVKILACVAFHLADGTAWQKLHNRPPIAVYIDNLVLQQHRSTALKRYLGRRKSKPTSAIFNLKLKQIKPSNSIHDPYIVALLIGVAQMQQKAHLAKEGNSVIPTTFPGKVFFSDYQDEQSFHIFTARIPSSLLAQFKNPAIPFESSAISIGHTTLPYRPYETFRDRLLPLFLHGLDTEERNLALKDFKFTLAHMTETASSPSNHSEL